MANNKSGIAYQPGYTTKGGGISYQPSYTINPKYGFRYMSQPFVDTVSPITKPSVPIMDAPPKESETVIQQDTTPAVMDSSGDSNVPPNLAPEVAESRGYTQTEANPAALLNVVPVVGPMLSSGFGIENNYGKEGTYDAEGNVFASDGRAYNPITGEAAASYSGNTSFYDSYTDSYGKLRDAGEGVIGSALGDYSASTYNIPREQRNYGATAAGQMGIRDTGTLIRENTALSNPDLIYTEPVYDDFDAVIDYKDPFTGKLKSERMDPTLSPNWDEEIMSPSYNQIGIRDLGIDPTQQGGSGITAFQEQREQGMPVTYGDRSKLGQFTEVRTGESSSDYVPDIGTGSVVETAFGPGVVNSSGQIETAQGTVIQMDNVNDGNVIQKPTQQEDSSNSGGK